MDGSASETQKDLAVLVNEIKHLTNNVNNLTNNVSSISEKVLNHDKKLENIEDAQKTRGKVYKFITDNWWKIALAVIAIDNTYNIVKNIPHK